MIQVGPDGLVVAGGGIEKFEQLLIERREQRR